MNIPRPPHKNNMTKTKHTYTKSSFKGNVLILFCILSEDILFLMQSGTLENPTEFVLYQNQGMRFGEREERERKYK